MSKRPTDRDFSESLPSKSLPQSQSSPHSKPTMDDLNINISAYRALYILILLVRFPALSLAELNHYLSTNPLIGKHFHEETISNYIIFLRKLGCQIQRPSSQNGFKYQLGKTPFSMQGKESDLQIAQKLVSLVASHPDEELHIQLLDIFRRILKWPSHLKQQEFLLQEVELALPSVAVQKNRELLKKYRKYCREAQILELDYQSDSTTKTTMTIEPSQVIQDGAKLYLLGVEREHHRMVKLSLEKIISVRQSPSKIEHRLKSVTVVFELYGRLAKTYRLYPNESVVSQTADTLVIQAKTYEYTTLLQRLMKYNVNCKVVSPHYVVEEMQLKIRKLIETLAPKE